MTRSQIGPTVIIFLSVAVGVFASGIPHGKPAASQDQPAGPPRPPAAGPRERFPDEAWLVRDLYARLMRYERAARQLTDGAPSAALAPDAYLTVVLRRIQTRDVAVGGEPRTLEPPAGPVLSVERRTFCHRDDPCHVAYAVEWASAAAAGSEAVPAGPVTRVTSYDVTLTLGSETRDYSAEVRYHAGDGGVLMPEVVDPVLPGLQQTLNDRVPAPVAPWPDYVRTRRYAAVVQRLKGLARAGQRVVPGRTPIGFLPGDEVTRQDEQEVMMASRMSCGPVSLAMWADDQALRPDGTGSPAATTIYVMTEPATPGVTVALTLAGERHSGGHMDDAHVGQRPAGSLSATSMTTNGNGGFYVSYAAPVIGERVTVTALAGGPQATLTLDIRVGGLVELGPGPNYELTGWTCPTCAAHPQGTNHWGTPYANGKLADIAIAYQDAFPGASPLLYNDQSLPWGGKFDFELRNWASGGHDEHRVGVNCDVGSNNVPSGRWAQLTDIFRASGSSNYVDETACCNHWHLRF